MTEQADHNDSVKISEGRSRHEDPRATKVGAFMRKYHLDEPPQILQAAAGELSLVGQRAILEVYKEHLQEEWSPERFESWMANYGIGKKGITGVYQVFGPEKRHDKSRYHMDLFYTKHASLGFDIYLLYKTFRKIVGV